jgi:hypothetical protein
MAKKSFCCAFPIVALFSLPIRDERVNLYDLNGRSLPSIAA